MKTNITKSVVAPSIFRLTFKLRITFKLYTLNSCIYTKVNPFLLSVSKIFCEKERLTWNNISTVLQQLGSVSTLNEEEPLETRTMM